MKTYLVVGLMSGTSLDGLDIALVSFSYDGSWRFKLIESMAVPYDESWQNALREAMDLSGVALKKLDIAYGRWLGEQVKRFMIKTQTQPDLIVSHGHTVFHQPEIGITLQIGDGYEIMTKTQTKTVCDLRSLDVALGGQGAPLVPIGDKLLFSDYEYCLNLGGFSNISTDIAAKRIAYDICPVNTVLNHLAARQHLPFDKDGQLARSGRPLPALLDALNRLSYYNQPPPKSLGIEWVNSQVLPMLTYPSAADLLHTYCLHIAYQISQAIKYQKTSDRGTPKVLVTGGGARNTFLMELIEKSLKTQASVVVPDDQTVDFKEAIIFAFLGLLRMLGEINTLKSVTGAYSDSSGGMVFDNRISPFAQENAPKNQLKSRSDSANDFFSFR